MKDIKEELIELLEDYKRRAINRKEKHNLSPRPLNKEEVAGIIRGLTLDDIEKETFAIFFSEKLPELLLRLLSSEVRRGTFPESYMKAEGLAKFVRGELKSKFMTPEKALKLLAEMYGGAASVSLVNLLKDGYYVSSIVDILKDTVLINKEDFEQLEKLSSEIPGIKILMKSWAEREFARNWILPKEYNGLVRKIGSNITTGHLSPSKYAGSRTDQPLHATYIMEGREDESDFMEKLESLKKSSEDIFLVAGKALGEGSSRKSATYTVLQVLGKPLKGEPEKKEGGVVIARSIAPIFKNSLMASGVLPVICNTESIKEGDQLRLNIEKQMITVNGEREISVELPGKSKMEMIAAGGMNYYNAGNELQKWAVAFCLQNNIEIKEKSDRVEGIVRHIKGIAINTGKKPAQTLAQKITALNRIDGRETILPGETAEVRVRGVFSQDTTGPMTLEEYQAMAGGEFGAEFVVQSLCHTGECPSTEERNRHRFLDEFVTSRGGVCLKPGEGIIHTIGNRFVLPTDVIVGGDSHTRTPRGLSFPAASDIVAAAMKYGKMDLTMDESVRVIFTGKPREGITARDLVSTLVIYAEKTVGKDIYNGRIIEMEGLEFLDSDKRYIMTNAVAERSASAGTIPPDEITLERIKTNLDYLKSRSDAETIPSVRDCIRTMEEYLKDPLILEADQNAEYAATITIPLEEVHEPLLAKPHHPDNVAYLSEVAGVELDEVFIGSCVGGDLESIRAAARIVEGLKVSHQLNFVVGPASLDIYNQLAADGSLACLTNAGATVIMPGCGLCMGNKRQIGSGAVALTTTTRNYQSRIGPADSKTYLGSAHLAAMAAVLGRIPNAEEYFKMYK